MSKTNQESEVLVLTLPLPPSVNSYYGYAAPRAHQVIKHVKPKGKEFLNEVKAYVQKNNFNIQANIPLKVEVMLCFTTNRAQDLDNRMKALLDSLTQAEVWLDDSLINDLHILRGPKSNPGSAIIKIQEYKND